VFQFWPGSLGVVFNVFACLHAYFKVVYVEIVHYSFLSYPFHFINDSKFAVQYDVTDAT
jgi:hypothetical protein